MLRVGLLVACFAAVICAVVADCSNGAVNYLNGNSGEFGCPNGWSKGTITWRVSSFLLCNVTFTKRYTPDAISFGIQSGAKNVDTLSSVNSVAANVPGLRVVFPSSFDAHSSYYVAFAYACRPILTPQPIEKLLSNQNVYVSNKTQGGFVYLSLGPVADGISVSYRMNIAHYRGLKPPSFFIGDNRLPSLESYDYTNTTFQSGTSQSWLFTMQNPPNSMLVIGMFLYGNFGGVDAFAQWRYSYETIPIGNAITRQNFWCGQFTAPERTKSFTLRVSREAPGGYPVFYVGQGYTPGIDHKDYELDTSKQSYQELDVKKPNDPNSGTANPGLWIVCTNKNFQGAFILGVDYS